MANGSTWHLKGGRALQLDPFCIMGVLNVTPDSFYDGGRHFDPGRAVEHARTMLEQGASIIDIGGESTRPFSDRVAADEELNRVIPVMEQILHKSPEAVLSVDTFKAAVAHKALESGAMIVNDVSAGRFDPELADVLASHRPGYVLMHSQGRPEEMQKSPSYDDVVGEILAFFEDRLARLTRSGLPEDRIALDPGLGFGKLLEHNLEILRHIDRFFSLGRPVLVGLSNKSMWGKLLGVGPEERQNATQAATALMAAKGVRLHRVHEVDLTWQTLTVAVHTEQQL
jgi:dihydropteroate synthase